MSSGPGEWEKGIPCMLHRSQRQAWRGRLLGLLSAWPVLLPTMGSLPRMKGAFFPGLGGGQQPLFTALVSTLAHKGKSQAPLSAPTGCETS